MIRQWWDRVRGLLTRRRRIADELREEIESHLELEIEDAVSAGRTPRSARSQFGNTTLIHEAAMNAWRFPALDSLFQDVRYGWRMLRREPGFTAAAVLSLAIGIGANTAIFSAVDALALRTLPVQAPEELVLFTRLETNGVLPEFSYRWFDRLRQPPAVYAGVSASWLIDRYNVRVPGGPGGEGQGPVSVMLASGNYFSNLGVRAVLGRTFSPDDDRVPGGHPVAVISHRYWRSRFALAPDVAGRSLIIHGTTFTILGVAPRGFDGEWIGRPADVWVPFAMASEVMPEVSGGPAQFPAILVGRLNPGVSIAQAEAASQSVWRHIVFEGAGANPTREHLQFLAERRLQLDRGSTGYSDRRPALARQLVILLTAVGVVLLIACANVANLLLARAEARQAEMALRLATGATRARLLRQLLTEGILLAALSGTVGLLLAIWAVGALTAMLAAGTATAASMTLDVHPDARVLAFTAALSLLTLLLFALVPAVRASQTSLSTALAGRGAAGRTRFGIGKGLVIVQVMLTVVLLTAAGLFVRTLRGLQTQDLGFARDHLLLAWTAPIHTGRSGDALASLVETIQQRVSALPGVAFASVSNGGVLEGGEDGGGPSQETVVEGLPPKPGRVLRYFAIAPRYFAAAGLPLLAGRDFADTDTAASPRVAIISEAMARFFFGDENPIGRRFGGARGVQLQIVGVARDARAGTARDQRCVWYVPYRQDLRALRRPWCLVVRTAGRPIDVTAQLRSELRAIDPALPVLRVNTLEDQLADVLAQDRMVAIISALFGVVAVIVASVGLYGVMAYTTARRTSEIGVRLAMGATRGAIVRMVLRESLLLLAAGLVLGIPLSLSAASVVSSRLFGVSPHDPAAICTAAGIMLIVGTAAAFVPACRASRVDPIVALR